ncbi:hypothetical protein D0X99_05245 [Algoriphagus lacus]|uniref:N-acetyltransferase n=1 Tax=Algoriphagus lacus TaxID=2056311 RepID=A0A418PUD1_9BACT|nr:hypothetical protein [Algoriphagus lacus]RIW17160.1 hypothetical protein D0X99_05245 [Algoriphagus lacus]
MRKGTLIDQNLVVSLMVRMFKDNPAVVSLIKPGKNIENGIRSLANSTFFQSLHRDGIWISSNEGAVALCFHFNSGKFSFQEFLLDLRFAIKYIGFKRLPGVLAREAYRKKQRPADGNYFYFWFFAALPDAGEAAFELKNGIFDMARKADLPIFTETSVERNQKIYERYGFKTYQIWEVPTTKIKFWFLKWEP